MKESSVYVDGEQIWISELERKFLLHEGILTQVGENRNGIFYEVLPEHAELFWETLDELENSDKYEFERLEPDSGRED